MNEFEILTKKAITKLLKKYGITSEIKTQYFPEESFIDIDEYDGSKFENTTNAYVEYEFDVTKEIWNKIESELNEISFVFFINDNFEIYPSEKMIEKMGD